MRALQGLSIAAVLALTIALSAGAAEPVIPVSDFRDLVARRMIVAMPGATVKVVDERTLELTRPDADGGRVAMDNVYEAYLREPARRDELADRLVAVVKQAGEGGEALRIERLVAIVRPAQILADTGLSGTKQIVTRPLAGDLLQVLAIDAATSIRYASFDDLAALKLSEQDAWPLAIRNVKARIGPVGVGGVENAAGVIGLSAESGLGPSVIFDPSSCGPDEPTRAGDRVILALSREAIAMGLLHDPVSLKAFWRLAGRMAVAKTPYSRTPITCEGGRWVVASPPKG